MLTVNTDSPWVRTAVGTRTFVVQCHVTASLRDNNRGSLSCCCNSRTSQVVKQEEVGVPDRECVSSAVCG